MYVYKQTEANAWGNLYTVGCYSPGGEWHPDSDHEAREEAAKRVRFLNGGTDEDTEARLGKMADIGAQMLKENTALKSDLAEAMTWLERLDAIFHHPTDCVDGLMAGDIRDFLTKSKARK